MRRETMDVRYFDDSDMPPTVSGTGTVPENARNLRMLITPSPEGAKKKSHTLYVRRLEKSGPLPDWIALEVITAGSGPFQTFPYELEPLGLRAGDAFQVQISPPPRRVVFDFT